eukprot:1469528-Prymnesium_polylepis.1
MASRGGGSKETEGEGMPKPTGCAAHCEIVVATHHLADGAPHARVLVVHAPYVADRRQISRVKGCEARCKTLSMLVLEPKPRVSNHL